MSEYALPDPIIPPPLAYEMGRRPEGRMLSNVDSLGRFDCDCNDEPIRLTERHPKKMPPLPTRVSRLFMRG